MAKTDDQKLYIGFDAHQLEPSSRKFKKPDFETGLTQLRCSYSSNDIEQIRKWVRARIARGIKSKVFIMQSVEEYGLIKP